MLAEQVRQHHARLRAQAGTFTELVRERHVLALRRHRLAETGENVDAIRIGESGILDEIAGHLEELQSKAEG
jgi:hypothetical protein